MAIATTQKLSNYDPYMFIHLWPYNPTSSYQCYKNMWYSPSPQDIYVFAEDLTLYKKKVKEKKSFSWRQWWLQSIWIYEMLYLNMTVPFINTQNSRKSMEFGICVTGKIWNVGIIIREKSYNLKSN